MDSVDLNQSHEFFCYLGQLLGDQFLPLFLLFTLCGVFAPMFSAAYVYYAMNWLVRTVVIHTFLLLQLVREYDGVGIQVLLASPSTPLCESLKRHGFFKRYSSEHLFPTVGSAVRYAKDGNRVVSVSVWCL